MAIKLNTYPLMRLASGTLASGASYRPTLCGRGVVTANGVTARQPTIVVNYLGAQYTIQHAVNVPGYGGVINQAVGFNCGGYGVGFEPLSVLKTTLRPYAAAIHDDTIITYCSIQSGGAAAYNTAAYNLYYHIGSNLPYAKKPIGFPTLVGNTANSVGTYVSSLYGQLVNGSAMSVPMNIFDSIRGDNIAGLYLRDTPGGLQNGMNLGRYQFSPFAGNAGNLWHRNLVSGPNYKYLPCDMGTYFGILNVNTSNTGITGVLSRQSGYNGIGLSYAIDIVGDYYFVGPDGVNSMRPNYKELFALPGLMLGATGSGADGLYPANQVGCRAVSVYPGAYIDENGKRRKWFSFAYHHNVGAVIDLNVPADGVSGASTYKLPDIYGETDNFVAIETPDDNDAYVLFYAAKPGTPRNGAFGYAADVTFDDLGPLRIWISVDGQIYSIWLGSDGAYWLCISAYESNRHGSSANFARYFSPTTTE